MGTRRECPGDTPPPLCPAAREADRRSPRRGTSALFDSQSSQSNRFRSNDERRGNLRSCQDFRAKEREKAPRARVYIYIYIRPDVGRAGGCVGGRWENGTERRRSAGWRFTTAAAAAAAAGLGWVLESLERANVPVVPTINTYNGRVDWAP